MAKFRKRAAWLFKGASKLPAGGKKGVRAGVTGKVRMKIGDRTYKRVSVHTRKVPHPNKSAAANYRRMVGETASEKASGIPGARVVKQKVWWKFGQEGFEDYESQPVWSVYKPNGGD